MNTPTLDQRIAAAEHRIRNHGLKRRKLRRHAARMEALLEVRDAAYRRLLAHNATLEADRRFTEAATTILTAWRASPVPASPSNIAAQLADVLGSLVDRLDEHAIDVELVTMNADTVEEAQR